MVNALVADNMSKSKASSSDSLSTTAYPSPSRLNSAPVYLDDHTVRETLGDIESGANLERIVNDARNADSMNVQRPKNVQRLLKRPGDGRPPLFPIRKGFINN